MEALEVFGLSLFFHFIIYGVGGVVSIYIDVSYLFRIELRGKQVVVDDSCAAYAAEKQCYGHTDEYFPFFHAPLNKVFLIGAKLAK